MPFPGEMPEEADPLASMQQRNAALRGASSDGGAEELPEGAGMPGYLADPTAALGLTLPEPLTASTPSEGQLWLAAKAKRKKKDDEEQEEPKPDAESGPEDAAESSGGPEEGAGEGGDGDGPDPESAPEDAAEQASTESPVERRKRLMERIRALRKKAQGKGKDDYPLSFSAAIVQSGLQLEAAVAEDGLVWKEVCATGKLALSPGPGQMDVEQPLELTPELFDQVVTAFQDGAIEHVTIPETHGNGVLENTGYVKQLEVRDGEDGSRRLWAGMQFTEPEVAAKVSRGSVANTSVGIKFGYRRKRDGKEYPAVLEHVALTNQPWVDGLQPFGAALSQQPGRVYLDELALGKLSSAARDALPESAFALPGRRYPIHDESHARNALARASGKPEEAQVKAAVYRRYPGLKPGKVEAGMDDAELEQVLLADCGMPHKKLAGEGRRKCPGCKADLTKLPEFKQGGPDSEGGGKAFGGKKAPPFVKASQDPPPPGRTRLRPRPGRPTIPGELTPSKDEGTMPTVEELLASQQAELEQSQRAQAKLTRDLKLAQDSLAKQELALHQERVGKRVRQLQAEGVPPAVLLKARDVMLADVPGSKGVSLQLSQEGTDEQLEVGSATELVELILSAVPRITGPASLTEVMGELDELNASQPKAKPVTDQVDALERELHPERFDADGNRIAAA